MILLQSQASKTRFYAHERLENLKGGSLLLCQGKAESQLAGDLLLYVVVLAP